MISLLRAPGQRNLNKSMWWMREKIAQTANKFRLELFSKWLAKKVYVIIITRLILGWLFFLAFFFRRHQEIFAVRSNAMAIITLFTKIAMWFINLCHVMISLTDFQRQRNIQKELNYIVAGAKFAWNLIKIFCIHILYSRAIHFWCSWAWTAS